MRIRKEYRDVFIGGGRTSFSRAAAYRNEARARIKAKYPCECDKPEHDDMGGCTYPGMTCDRHTWPEGKWTRLVQRLARWLWFMDKRERETQLVRYAVEEQVRRTHERAHRVAVRKATKELKRETQLSAEPVRLMATRKTNEKAT